MTEALSERLGLAEPAPVEPRPAAPAARLLFSNEFGLILLIGLTFARIHERQLLAEALRASPLPLARGAQVLAVGGELVVQGPSGLRTIAADDLTATRGSSAAHRGRINIKASS